MAWALLRKIARRRALVSSYLEYWNRLVPKGHKEYMDRWVFAISSIVNTWQNNCRSYRFITELGYPLSRFGYVGLLSKLRQSGCGVHTRRTQSLWAVDRGLRNDPAAWYPREGEGLPEFRGRL